MKKDVLRFGLRFIKTAFLVVSLCLIVGILIFAIFFFSSEWLCPEFHGSYHLGHGIYMMEWEDGDRIIVKGTNVRGNTCYGGLLLVPTYESQYDSLGRRQEYVKDARPDGEYIIVKTGNHQTNISKYYIISNKSDVITNGVATDNIICFTDSVKFQKKCDSLNINNVFER